MCDRLTDGNAIASTALAHCKNAYRCRDSMDACYAWGLKFSLKLCPKVGLCIVDECVLCSRFYGPLWILFSDVCTMNDASGQLYTINSVKVQFPCKAYPSQLSMMDKVSMSYALCTLHVQDVQLLETDHAALCVKILSLPA